MGEAAAEFGERVKLMAALFSAYRETDTQRARMYVVETEEIPLDKLRVAVRSLVRTHRWPRLPAIADLWALAKEAAGMNRQQYHAGRYIAKPREWPPEGKRHAIHAGQVELMPTADHVRLPAGMHPALEAGPEDAA